MAVPQIIILVVGLGAAAASGCQSSREPSTHGDPLPSKKPPETAPTVVTPPATTDAAPEATAPSNCKSTATDLALQWIDRDMAARHANYKPGSHGLTAASFKAAHKQPDLNGDGTSDTVIHDGASGLRSARHFFFVIDGGCPKFVGTISFSPLLGHYCRTTRHNGLCELRVARMMIHGETETSTWRYNGVTYERHGQPTLSPRRGKFR